MTEWAALFWKAWIPSQTLSLLALWAGSRLTDRALLVRLGQIAHEKKLRALDRMWPLTRIRPALEQGDLRSCTVVLSSLIAIKTLASLAFGLIMVFWLPLASAVVPSLIAVHDPENEDLAAWVRRVATLQVTSHTLAAALGFALVFGTWNLEEPLGSALARVDGFAFAVLLASLAFALIAGRAEAKGLLKYQL